MEKFTLKKGPRALLSPITCSQNYRDAVIKKTKEEEMSYSKLVKYALYKTYGILMEI